MLCILCIIHIWFTKQIFPLENEFHAGIRQNWMMYCKESRESEREGEKECEREKELYYPQSALAKKKILNRLLVRTSVCSCACVCLWMSVCLGICTHTPYTPVSPVCKCTLGRLYLQWVYCIRFKAILLRLIYIVCYGRLSPLR